MIFASEQNLVRRCAMLGATLTALAGAALLTGCKGNTSAAANLDRRTGQPPVVTAQAIGQTSDVGLANPMTSSVWKEATWWPLVAPANTSHTTPASRAAVLYDADTLYVAVVNEMPVTGREPAQDAVSLYVDTTGEGKEILQITTDAQGVTQCAWIRSSVPAAPREDGSPNMGYPLDIRPDFKIGGLKTQVSRGVADGRAVWTVEMAVPVAGMPPVMQVLPGSAAHWKFNVLRAMTRGGEQYQANVSPVYVNAQAVSAYRMAELAFGGQ
jgi:hypothetical protein